MSLLPRSLKGSQLKLLAVMAPARVKHHQGQAIASVLPQSPTLAFQTSRMPIFLKIPS